MSSLPRELAGVGSSVNNTVRQVGGALGVAVLGTLLSASYRSGVEPALDAAPLPDAAKDAAAASIAATDAAITESGGRADALRAPAYDAFIDAMHTTAIWSAVVIAIGVAVCLRFMPGRSRTPTSTAGQPAGAAVVG
jgi:hypothetical protein